MKGKKKSAEPVAKAEAEVSKYLEEIQAERLWALRRGAFQLGAIFLAMAGVDGAIDCFRSPEIFFGGTGVSLIIGSITRKKPQEES